MSSDVNNEEAQIKVLNEFVEQLDCLDELDKYKNDVNFFEITGMVRREIKHSNFLAWLFDANGSHKLGNGFIRRFVLSVIKANPEFFKDTDFVDFSVFDYSDFMIYREKDQLDIFMISNSQKTTITIENKIDAEEGKQQTRGYRDKVQRTYT